MRAFQRACYLGCCNSSLRGGTDIEIDVEDMEVDVDIDRYLRCFKGGLTVSLGIVQWYRISHGTDFEISEIAGPVSCGCLL